MADADSRKERFQGNLIDREEDGVLYQRYLKMKQERDVDKSEDSGNRINLEDAVDIVGTCDMMCPEFESLQRYFEHNLDPFEKSPTGAYDRSLMVQIFARAAAGNDLPPSEDIRPPPILRVTVDYLLDKILLQNGIEATHNFLWNRTRAVRSDLIRQRDHSVDAIYCLERIVRYHILALHVVCRGQREVETLEIEQLKKALQSLMEVYHDARATYSSPNEPEFRAYYTLMHIRSRHAPFTLKALPPAVYNSPMLQWALRIRFSMARNTDGADEHNSDVTQMDHTGFFELVSNPSTSYLTACLLESHFDDIRRQICLMLGLTLKNTFRSIPIYAFQQLLRLDTIEDAIGWLSHLKWNVTPDGIVDIPQSRKVDVLIPPIATATAYPRPKSNIVRAKRDELAHATGPIGVLDSVITQHWGATFGKGYINPPSEPRRRRQPVQYMNFGQPTTRGSFSQHSNQAVPFTVSAPANTLAFIPSARPQSQPPPKPLFNPFGPRPNVPNITNSPAPKPAPISAFQAAPTNIPPAQFQPPVVPSFPPVSVLPPQLSQPPSFFPTVSINPTFTPLPQTVSIPVQLPPPPAPVPQPAQPQFSFGPAATYIPPPAAALPLVQRPLLPSSISQLDVSEVDSPVPPSFPPLTDGAEDGASVNTTPPVRPSDLKRELSDGSTSAASSILPASTRGEDHESMPIESKDLKIEDTRSNASSDTDAGRPDRVSPLKQSLLLQAEEHSRLATLRNSVQQWRESVKDKEKSQEIIARKERAEQSARDVSLGARFISSKQAPVQAPSRKRIIREVGATQDFIMAEKEVDDQKRIFAPKTFARIISQVAKRRAGDKDLPAGWQTWVSFVPGGSSTSEWLKLKLAGHADAPDLANITIGPPANSGIVAAPGLLLLHIDPRDWDGNLRRAQEFLDLLPGDSPYRPGLLLVMVAHKSQKFPKTWVSKLDRMLTGVVMDRKAVVFTSMDSSQALESTFHSQFSELKFDVEGSAQSLDLKELVVEYMNWWQMEFQYGFQQTFEPTPDLDRLLLVLGVLMSGLDEFLRQMMLQCQVSEIDIPFNNFQSQRDLEGACREMLDYLADLGGDTRRFPQTPAAILQQPDILFQILLDISEQLKDLVLEHRGILQPRAGLRRPLLQRLGKEYNVILERELAPVDRSSIIYAPTNGVTATPTTTNLKRKRRSSSSAGILRGSESERENGRRDMSLSLKRTRTTPTDDTSKAQSKASFKVQMAKARLDLRVIQATDVGTFSSEDDRDSARASELSSIAEPLLLQLISSDITQDKTVVEARAILELIEEANDAIFNKISENDTLVNLINQLGNIKRLSSSLDFRELQNIARHLAGQSIS